MSASDYQKMLTNLRDGIIDDSATEATTYRQPTFYRCGICESWHSTMFDGECREDSERFELDDLDTLYGPSGWVEVDQP